MKKFYSKILLFGEYSVLAGSSAMTVPNKKFEGSFGRSDSLNSTSVESNQILRNFCLYLIENSDRISVNIDLQRFQHDIDNGLYFKSNIPVGYGLGSSGALVAAMFDQYSNLSNTRKNQEFYLVLKKNMALAESFFHGTSSGIDPLSIYMGKPIIFNKNHILFPGISGFDEKIGHFYLFDTGIKAETASLVDIFMNKLKEKDYLTELLKTLVPVTDQCIAAVIEQDNQAIRDSMKKLSRFQFRFLNESIPASSLDIWQEGIRSEDFFFKLCGSGGGGYLLVWSEIPKEMLELKLNTSLSGISTLLKDYPTTYHVSNWHNK